MLDKILSALDESVFTESVKQEIHESFEDAVNTKAHLMTEEKIQLLEEKSGQHIEMLNEKSEQHIEMLNEKSEQYIDMLNEKSEEHIKFLEDKAEEYVTIRESELAEKVSQYLDRIVEEFVSEAQEALEESAKSVENEVLREAFEAMVKVGGAEFHKTMVESADETVKQEIQSLKENFNNAMQEVFELKSRNQELLQMGIIQEFCSDMTLVESERFKRLASSIEFTGDKRYVERLDAIKESITGIDSKEAPVAPEVITESRIQAKRSEGYGELFSFGHLI